MTLLAYALNDANPDIPGFHPARNIVAVASLLLRILSLVYLEPRLAGGGAWPLPHEPVAACVVWPSALGVGLEWCDPPEQFVENLVNYVALAALPTVHREDRPAAG